MKRVLNLVFCLTLMSSLISGCSGESEPAAPTSDAIVSTLKADLKLIVETGEGGSGLEMLRTSFEELKKQAPEKAQAVESDFQELLKTPKPETRKSLASKIIDSL